MKRQPNVWQVLFTLFLSKTNTWQKVTTMVDPMTFYLKCMGPPDDNWFVYWYISQTVRVHVMTFYLENLIRTSNSIRMLLESLETFWKIFYKIKHKFWCILHWQNLTINKNQTLKIFLIKNLFCPLLWGGFICIK